MDSSQKLGKEIYAKKYKENLQLQAQWLSFGAIEKTNSIQILLERNSIKPRTILELGCGTGAILHECQQRGIAEDYLGIDYSEDAIAYLKDHVPGVRALAADIYNDDLQLDETFDVVVLSHVLEHLEEPKKLLASLTSKIRFKHLIAEVPLEDLDLLRLRSRIWGRPGEKAGHVQFYTAQSFETLLESSGFKILDRRQYLPIPTRQSLELAYRMNDEPRKAHYRRLAGRYMKRALRPVWQKLYYAHHACLCSIAP